MAYIGNVPSHGEFKKADSIVSSFNGTLTQFDLDYDTVNQTVGDATQLIVSLNGIVQEPGTAYTLGIGGGSVVFASAPASTDTCHIVLLGGVGGTTTPTDGSVTASKLDSNLKDYLEETFTADGTQTVFTLTRAVVGANTLLVTIDGIVQPSSAFTASGTTLTISEVLAATTNVRVVHMGVKAGIYVPANDSVTADMLANSINTDIAAGVAALPKAGGTLTGNLGVTGTVTADAGSWSTVVSGNAITFDRNGENNIIADNGSSANLNLTAGNRIFYSADDYQSFKIGSSPTEKLRIRSTGIDVTGNISLAASDGFAYLSNVGTGNAGIYIRGIGANNTLRSHSTGDFRWEVTGSQKMMLDASGNLLVGKTAPTISTTGVELRPNGQVFATQSGAYPLLLNRTTSDGDIVQFRKDNTTVGSIGANGGSIIVGSGNTGLYFDDGSDRLIPVDPVSASGRDNAINLGGGSERFKDLYLSGGVYLGGIGSANKLDDYEEGTWTPTVSGHSTAGTMTYSDRNGKYTKVGRLVTIHFYLQGSSGTGSGNLLLGGIPFTIASGHMSYGSPQWNGGISYPSGAVDANWLRFDANSFDIRCNKNNAAHAQIPYPSNPSYLRGCITYETDQ